MSHDDTYEFDELAIAAHSDAMQDNGDAEKKRATEERNKAVVARFDDLGNGKGDIETLDELCTPNMVNHALRADAAPGLEGSRNFLLKAQRSKYPARWVESHIVADGDYVVQFGVREQMWPGGRFRGYEFEAGTFQRETTFAYRLENGRIAERWAIRDDLAMVLALGGRPIAADSPK
jgi:predicted ester cyclase